MDPDYKCVVLAGALEHGSILGSGTYLLNVINGYLCIVSVQNSLYLNVSLDLVQFNYYTD